MAKSEETYGQFFSICWSTVLQPPSDALDLFLTRSTLRSLLPTCKPPLMLSPNGAISGDFPGPKSAAMVFGLARSWLSCASQWPLAGSRPILPLPRCYAHSLLAVGRTCRPHSRPWPSTFCTKCLVGPIRRPTCFLLAIPALHIFPTPLSEWSSLAITLALWRR